MAINLAKESEKVTIVLTKKKIFNEKADIIVIQDVSGSMSMSFHTGIVQDIFTKMLAIGMNLDFNRQIDVFAFNEHAHHIGNVNESNLNGFVDNIFLRKTRVLGGTRYSSAIESILENYGIKEQPQGFFKKLFGRKETAPQPVIPKLIFFITDGDNAYSDYERTKKLLIDASNQPIFWQFIGIGNQEFAFLKELDTMSGRTVDNANFFQANSGMTNENLYESILQEFPSWLQEVRDKKILSTNGGK